ncbi:MAG: tetratricopeptide repeat-containing protein, partial [Solobacterium sp.]|nr:tetratricopeptide repeat-containing protein [Solobacterium sp.]
NISNKLSDFRNLEISYNRLIRKSFISTDDGTRRIFHNIVREAIYADKDYSENSKKENLKAIAGYYKELLNQPEISNETVLFIEDRLIFMCQEIASDREDFESIWPMLDRCTGLLMAVDIRKYLELILTIYNSKDKFCFTEKEANGISANLTSALDTNGRYREAFEIRKQLTDYALSVYGDSHIETLRRMNDLANSYHNLGDYEEAARIREEAYAKSKEVLGNDHKVTQTILFNLANSLSEAGRNDEVLKIREEMYKNQKETLGEDHPDTLGTLGSLAISYSDLGRLDDAKSTYEKVYQRRKEVLGENHPDTLVSLYNLSTVYSKLGLYKECLQIEREAYENQKEILGELHPDTLKTLSAMAGTMANLGQHSEVLEFRKEVFEKSKISLGELHRFTLAAIDNLVIAYHNLGQKQEELKTLTDEHELYRKAYGETDSRTLKKLISLAVLNYRTGNVEEAKNLYRNSLAGYEQKAILSEQDENDLVNVLYLLAYLYNQENRSEEAEELLGRMFEHLLNVRDDSSLVSLKRFRQDCSLYLDLLDKHKNHQRALDVGKEMIRASESIRAINNEKPDKLEMNVLYLCGFKAHILKKLEEGFEYNLKAIKLTEEYSIPDYEYKRGIAYNLNGYDLFKWNRTAEAIESQLKAFAIFTKLADEDKKVTGYLENSAKALSIFYSALGNTKESEHYSEIRKAIHAKTATQ